MLRQIGFNELPPTLYLFPFFLTELNATGFDIILSNIVVWKVGKAFVLKTNVILSWAKVSHFRQF